MSVLANAAVMGGEPDTGDITKSLRFRASGSTYLSRTPAGAGNLKTWTISLWVKRGALSVASHALFGTGANNTNDTICYFGPGGSGDTIDIVVRATSVIQGRLTTTQVFRDPSAWMHIVFTYNSPDATASERMKLYVNGTRVTAFSSETQPAQNTDTLWNTARALYIGRMRDDTPNYFDGYLSRVCFVDGSALTPSSFGTLNTEVNEWVSKTKAQIRTAVGSFGTNGFMLNFENGSSLTTLGYDTKGADGDTGGNNWTLNNHSLTAGTSYDWMDDRPGNSYAVLNPLKISTSTTISAANLDTAATASSWNTVFSTIPTPTTGKWYAEVTVVDVSADYSTKRVGVGVMKVDGTEQGSYVGSSANGYGYFANATKFNNASSGAYGATYVTNDVIGIALDLDAGTLVFYKNNSTQGTAYSSLSGELVFAVSHYGSSAKVSLNCGQRPFTYTPPTGFKALCQQNLPEGAVRNPRKHFDVKTRTGTAATYSVTGIEFQPDLVWSKSRGRAVDHALFDSVRGVQKMLESNQTGAESTEATGLTAFNSDGYTGGALDQINGTTATNSFVDWLWKANGAAVTNTAGSITSQVSANTTAGFSIVTYTGTGANATVGHGLGVAPSLVIVKKRTSDATPKNWPTWHKSLAGTETLYLNLTQAKVTAVWPSGPSSTVFNVGTDNEANGNTWQYVAYCFAEIPGFSRIGSYTGNGSADGPFVWCGFKPRWVLIKSTGIESWFMHDTARDTYNVVQLNLNPNTSNAEGTFVALDVTANGFKVRTTNSGWNTNAQSYIFIAIADTNFKYANGR